MNSYILVNIKSWLELSLNKMQFQTNAEARISPTKLNSSSNIVLELENDKNDDDLNKTEIKSELNEISNDEVNYSSLNNQNVLIEKNGGLSNKHVLAILSLWYLFSAFTLFTNKYLVTNGGDPTLLGGYLIYFHKFPPLLLLL